MSDFMSRRGVITAGAGVLGLGVVASKASAQAPAKKESPELQQLIEAIEAKASNKFVVLGPFQVNVPKTHQLEVLSFEAGTKPPGANVCVVVSVNQNNVKGAFQILKEDGTVANVEKLIPSHRPLALWCCGAMLDQLDVSYTATYHILVPPS